MPLSPGSRLGPYEIIGAIGAGGMGEVYRARDTRLERIVAIKVITAAIADTPDLRQRFEREARTLSTLNHPNICTIHDVGRQDDVEYLVLEYVEGETLAARIERGPLPAEDVIRRGVELAGALDRAHRAGIVHRDLKPANIMLTKTGVKVLDFGLARFRAQQTADAHGAVTVPSASLTGQGSILGTLHYMSPEQLEGREVDARCDIFALGIVLYEMATGRRPFDAKSQASLIAAILEHEPPPLTLSGRSGGIAPAAFERVVRRCLAKDPDDRWQTSRDVVIELEALDDVPAAEPVAPPPGPPTTNRAALRSRAIAVAALIAGAALGAAGYAWWTARAAPVDAPELRLHVVTPPTPSPIHIAFSPDGRQIAFVAMPADRPRPELWLRALDDVENRRLPGTDGAQFPFWSADSRSIAFFADSRLKRYDLAGGAVQSIAAAPLGRGGAWNADGFILFAPSVGGLHRVSAAGGESVAITTVSAPAETSHRFPEFLPDGNQFVYFVQGNADVQGVYLASLADPKGRRLLASDTRAVFVRPSMLLFVRQGALYAQQLDAARGRLVGDAMRIAEPVAFDGAVNAAAVTASRTGLIAYRSGSPNELVWVDRTGKPLEVVPLPESGPQNCPELSPDGRRIAIDRSVAGNRDVWIIDQSRNITTRFTHDSGVDATPLWSRDGTRILFRSNRSGINQLWMKAASGATAERRIASVDLGVGVGDWSADGRHVLFIVIDPATGIDIMGMTLEGGQPFPVVKTPFEERDPQFSPNGRWIAYTSNESGHPEVYVQAFPESRGTQQVSVNGGTQARWRGDGRELYYLSNDGKVTAVPIERRGDDIDAGTPQVLFQGRAISAQGGLLRQQYAVSADGTRFLLNAVSAQAAGAPITIVSNWRGLAR